MQAEQGEGEAPAEPLISNRGSPSPSSAFIGGFNYPSAKIRFPKRSSSVEQRLTNQARARMLISVKARVPRGDSKMQISQRCRFLAVFAVFIGFTAACSQKARQVKGVPLNEQPMIGQAAPDFRLKAVGGGFVSLSDLRGKFLVVHFAATW